MKTIKTHTGTRRIDELDTPVFLSQLRELLTDYRASLISRLFEDLSTYLDYKFHIRPTLEQLPELKVRLYSLKISRVDMERYQFIVKDIMAHESTYLGTEPFYTEIDEYIKWYLEEKRLMVA